MSTPTTSSQAARGRVRIETGTKRIRAYLGGAVVADTTTPLLVWERPYYPTYYFPIADVRSGAARGRRNRRSLPQPRRRPPLLGPGRRQARGSRRRAPRDIAVRSAARRDPVRVGRHGRVVRGGRRGLHAPPRPVHARRHPGQLTARADRGSTGSPWPSRRARDCCSRPACRSATTCPSRTCGWTFWPPPTP